MKKILFLIHDLSHGGAEKVLVNLVNFMDKDKFDVTVMVMFGGGVNKQFLHNDVRYIEWFPKPFKGNSHIMKLFSPKFLYKHFIKEEYDIAISYLEGPSSRVVSGCPNSNTKLVSWIHCTLKTKKEFAIGFRNYKEAKKCFQKFNLNICVSKGVEKAFKNKINISNIKTKVLYNVNNSEEIIALGNDKIENHIFNKNEINICAVGKIMPVKGFDRLARVHKKLIDFNYPVHTYILGIGSEKEKIQDYISANNLEKTFTFLGYQTNPYKFMKKCDLFVCSSYSEGFSTATTEALILGIPVVTTNISGSKEMLGNNEYGIIVNNNEDDLYKGIKSLLDDIKKLNHYKKQAIKCGKYYSVGNTVKSIEECLESL